MAQINWTKRSIQDLKSIYDYISLDSTFYAARFISKLIKRVDILIEFPESGRMVPEKTHQKLES
jgi:plasmid stabilization system protein ParE